MKTEADTLTENDVIDAVCACLGRAGWGVEQRLRTTERGADIIARRSNQAVLRVEAKGATSSKAGTARHGRPFGRAQIRSHVARAFYTAVAAIDDAHALETAMSAMAFPATGSHQALVEPISKALEQLRIGVFWVDTPDRVRLDAPWSL